MLINELFRFQGIKMTDIDDIIISSVVPPLVIPLSKMCERYFKIRPLLVGPGIKRVSDSCMKIRAFWVPTVSSMS